MGFVFAAAYISHSSIRRRSANMLFAITLTALSFNLFAYSKEYLANLFNSTEWITGYVLATELTSDDNPHYHIYLRTDDATFNQVRDYLYSCLFPGATEDELNLINVNIDVQRCRSEKSWLQYITKEDANPLYKGVRTSYFSFYWHLQQYNKKNKVFDYNHPFIANHFNKVNLIKNAHASYWQKRQVENIQYPLGPFTFRQAQLSRMLETDKHYYIYGSSGAGKTTVIERYLREKELSVCVLSCTTQPFEFGSIEDTTEVVYAPDVDLTWLQHHLPTLLRLCDRQLVTVNCKFVQGKRLLFTGQLIVASNYAPPSLPGFARRFVAIDIDGFQET